MNETKQTLWKDYDEINDLMKMVNIQDEQYKMLLEEKDKIRNELIKLEQTQSEAKIKLEQIVAEDKREKKRNLITIGTFTVTTGVSIFGIIKTFRFDQESTITSTLGRGFLNGVIPKMFKR